MAAIQKCRLKTHPAYQLHSPALAPAHHIPFPQMKRELSSCNFDSDEVIIAAVDLFLEVLRTAGLSVLMYEGTNEKLIC